MKIFIVEDNSFYAELLSYDLLSKSHDVEVFNSAESCIEAFHDVIPDVLVLDFFLRDGADGIEVLNEIKKFEHSNCKIVMLTSSSSKEVKRLTMENGANYFLNKSIDSGHELSRIIKGITCS